MKTHMDHKLERVLHEVGGVPRIHTHMQIHMCMYANSTSQFYVAPAHFLGDGKTTLPLLPRKKKRKALTWVTENPK